MDSMKHRRLQELDRSDFEIVDGEPDIRGWDVRNERGRKLGEVEELIVDAQQKKVRYMVVDLEHNELEMDHRKVLSPIGMAQLHGENDDVIIPGLDDTHIRNLPEYNEDRLTPVEERKIGEALGLRSELVSGNQSPEELPPDFYKHDYYNTDNLYKNRLHDATPVSRSRQQSEYERGLHLWEKRSEGGILPSQESGRGSSRSQEHRMSHEERMEMVRNRRRDYEHRRNQRPADHNRSQKANSFERRIRDEGLRDA